MAGTKTAAKNSRASSKSANSLANNTEIPFILSCNGGHNAYVRHPVTAHNPNLATNSQAFTDAICAIRGAGNGAKVQAELVALATAGHPGAWPSVLERLRTEELVA